MRSFSFAVFVLSVGIVIPMVSPLSTDAFRDSVVDAVQTLSDQNAFSEKFFAGKFDGKKPAKREDIVQWLLAIKTKDSNTKSTAEIQEYLDIIGISSIWTENKTLALHKKISRIDALQFLLELENIPLWNTKTTQSTYQSIVDFPNDTKKKAMLIWALENNLIAENTEHQILPNATMNRNELANFIIDFYDAVPTDSKLTIEAVNSDYLTIQNIIEKNYLFKEKVDMKAVETNAFSAMLDTLDDPYSEYLPAEINEKFEEYMQQSSSVVGGYAGIGAAVQESKNPKGIVISELFDGSPALQAGVQVGDVITKVGTNNISEMSLEQSVSLIKGPEDSIITITIVRNGTPREFTFMRKKIVVSNYENISSTTKENIAWITVRGFKTTSGDEFASLLQNTITDSTKGIIIDLRYNPGGVLESAVEMLGEVLPKHSIASRLREHGNETVYKVAGSGDYTEIPLVVLQNQYSASASEIFAASIQDYKRGRIIGTTSYGKGVAQNLFTLSNGGSVKLTTAEFVSPLGNTIHQKGVVPDISLNETDNQSLFTAAKKEIEAMRK